MGNVERDEGEVDDDDDRVVGGMSFLPCSGTEVSSAVIAFPAAAAAAAADDDDDNDDDDDGIAPVVVFVWEPGPPMLALVVGLFWASSDFVAALMRSCTLVTSRGKDDESSILVSASSKPFDAAESAMVS